MKFEPITIPEYHRDYPSLWVSKCKRFRLIRCKDDIQYILQAYKTPKFRNLSYHQFYDSLLLCWPDMSLPEVAPDRSLEMITFNKAYEVL
jgi:hypothetical protein